MAGLKTNWAPHRKGWVAASLQRSDGPVQPRPCDVTGRDVQQPETGHGGCRGDQLGEKVIVEAVAGNAQLGDAGLEF